MEMLKAKTEKLVDKLKKIDETALDQDDVQEVNFEI